MPPLEKNYRNLLERTVKLARETAEDAARIALEQLGVGESAPFYHLTEAERALRRKLRIHGRQLGDALNGGKVQNMDRLTEEVAYEHWHRMLFARFLAENELLMYVESTENTEDTEREKKVMGASVPSVSSVDNPFENAVAVTLEECEELAEEEGAANGWELAARFATRMLPQIFRTDSPIFQLKLPPEHQQKLERLLAELPSDVFLASDSIGWVYQFWQARKKDEVNASEVKIGARELPAVTQLFTEPYMVSFLLDNSLGAWWAARRLTESALKNASSEQELRRKAAIPGVPLDYLRFVQQEDGTWTPAAGTFDGWPEQLADLKTIDPCCGSGHFLVAAFLMLVPMRMEREGLSAKKAADAVLRENIHGLELDQRCVELAAFALALTAWKYPSAGGYRVLPELNVACSGLSVSVAKEEWKQLGLGKKNLTIALDWMHDTFKDAPVLGSLLNPGKTDAAKLVQWGELSSVLEQALRQEQSEEQQEAAVVAQGLAKAATLLAGRYQWVITNVPYLARGKQNERLRGFCEKHYSAAKNDLATVFLDRCLELCVQGGSSSIVLPQNWLFLTSYKKFREKLLKNDTWHLIARLGEGGFDSSAAAGAFVAMLSLSRGNSTMDSGGLFGNSEGGNLIRGVDVSDPRTAAEKAAQLLTAEIKSVEQARQLENPDARITLDQHDHDLLLLNEYAECYQGMRTGEKELFLRFFWELQDRSIHWDLFRNSNNSSESWGGMHEVILWEKGAGRLHKFAAERREMLHDMHESGNKAWGRKGVAINQMRQLKASFFTGEKFDGNVSVIFPKNEKYFAPLWSFCSSIEYNEAVRLIDQKLNVTNATLIKVPFDLDHWTKVAEEKYPNGLPKPYTDDPTQWIFHGHPCGSVIWDDEQKRTGHGPLRTDDSVLHVAVARLLGYRWPAELESRSGILPLKEKRQDGASTMELADEQREWVNRCEALLPYADKDGIVCIPPVRGEFSAADRLLNLLAAAFKAYGSTENTDSTEIGKNNSVLSVFSVPSVDKIPSFSSWIDLLLKNADHEGKSLDTWLREKFFTQHCKLFQHRPFIWNIWDGLRDGFAALVNYHKLDRKKLETLIYTYLGDWIRSQKQDIDNGVDGAQERLAAAEGLKKRLELILEGEEPYDIFVRWKPIEKQPIGWDPDLNDGVRLNIRPFMTVPDVGKKGAGVLRDKPNIKWGKDRGKDVASAPWYHLFKGDRINDHHLTLADKKGVHGKHGSHGKGKLD